MSCKEWLIGLLFLIFSSLIGRSVLAQNLSASNTYLLHCSGCHGPDGAGTRAGGIPALDLVKTFTGDNDGRKYLLQVPGVAYSGLGNTDIALVLNYVITRWGQPNIPFQNFTTAEVDSLRATDIDDIVSYRRNLTKRYIAEGKLVADYPWP